MPGVAAASIEHGQSGGEAATLYRASTQCPPVHGTVRVPQSLATGSRLRPDRQGLTGGHEAGHTEAQHPAVCPYSFAVAYIPPATPYFIIIIFTFIRLFFMLNQRKNSSNKKII